MVQALSTVYCNTRKIKDLRIRNFRLNQIGSYDSNLNLIRV